MTMSGVITLWDFLTKCQLQWHSKRWIGSNAEIDAEKCTYREAVMGAWGLASRGIKSLPLPSCIIFSANSRLGWVPGKVAQYSLSLTGACSYEDTLQVISLVIHDFSKHHIRFHYLQWPTTMGGAHAASHIIKFQAILHLQASEQWQFAHKR